MSDMFDRLRAPFPADIVSWRIGSTTKDKAKGMALAYIDARDVMARLDDVCGPDGWERRHPHVGGTTTCEIALWVPDRERWVVKSDGAGDTDVEAEKGSLSDSFKRAAVNWGVGRYLYDLPSPWVKLTEFKAIDPAELPKLRALLANRSAPSKLAEVPPEQQGLYVACKAALDLAIDQAALEAWAKDNTVSMERIKDENPAVYAAVRKLYAQKLHGFAQKVAA